MAMKESELNRRGGEEEERKMVGGLNDVRKQTQDVVCLCAQYCRLQEERTDEELLMALLLSLSAHCDSQNQLLTKTTSPWKRRKCSQEVRKIRAELCREEVERRH